MKKKDFIGGKKISKKEALSGLGNPKDWPKLEAKVKQSFRCKCHTQGVCPVHSKKY